MGKIAPIAPESPLPVTSREEILNALNVLLDPDAIVELRAIKKSPNEVRSGCFDQSHWDDLADVAFELNQAGFNCYITMNPIASRLQSHPWNEVGKTSKAASDQDIAKRNWLLIDIDPVRPSNAASTKEQLQFALVTTKAVFSFLTKRGWPTPVAAYSGNGVHLLYKINLPNTSESKELVRNALLSLASLFDSKDVKIDTGVHNASRITKLYGTVSTKGVHTAVTPWRLSQMGKVPSPLIEVTQEQLQELSTVSDGASSAGRDVNEEFQIHTEEATPQGVTDLLLSALEVIDAEPRDIWLIVGAALHFETGGTAAGLGEWVNWSKKCLEKFDMEDSKRVWKSFDDSRENKVTAGTIYHLAKEAGWKPPRDIQEGPLPLRRPLPPPTEFPLDALPAVLRDTVDLVVDCLRVPPALAGQSALAAATLAVQGLANISIDGRVYPVSNFFVTVAESGERKSAVDRLFLVPHHEHQKILATLAASQRVDFNLEHTAWKTRRDAWVKKHKTPAIFDSSTLIKDIGKEPVPPRDPLFLVEEPTYEGLIKLLETGQPSVGLFSDEGGRFIGGHGMSKDNILKTIAGLSKLWDGDPITRSRSGDGHLILYNRRCSMHLMIQPQIMSSVFGQELLAAQGFLSRVLCAFPSSTIGSRRYRENDLSSHPTYKAYTERLGNLLKTPLAMDIENPAMGLQIPTLTIQADAKQEWIKFHDRVESGLGDNQRFSSVKGFAAKAAEHALRISSVLSRVENPSCISVNLFAMKQAIQLVDYYLLEAVRLIGQGHDSPDLEIAEKCLTWCQKQDGGCIDLVSLYQRGPNPVRGKDNALKYVKILTDHGWLQPIGDRQSQSRVWRVLPSPPC